MFSLKKLLLLSITLIGATAAPVDSGSDSLAVRISAPSAVVPKAVLDLSIPGDLDGGIDTRATSRTRLFWSSQGRFLFMMNLGSKIPQAMIDAFSGVGEAGPGKVMMQNFIDWVRSVGLEYRGLPGYGASIQDVTAAITNAAVKGGMYSKGGQTSFVGWGMQLDTTDNNVINAVARLINDWATLTGPFPSMNLDHNPVSLAISQRPNDFISLDMIRGGTTAKRDARLQQRHDPYTCPAGWKILNYAVNDVSDNVDLVHGIRFVGLC